jgi:uncharacterized protein YecE (DUF72 family)
MVYPVPKPKGFDALSYLAEYFDTVEINSSFYRPPAARISGSWVRRVQHNPRFKFTAKVWSRLTHEKQNYSAAEIEEFLVGLRPIFDAGQLGALLLQFPWSFKNGAAQRDRLAKLAEDLRSWPLVLEVRHASWNDDQVFDFLRKHRMGFCNIDQPVIGQSLQPSAVVCSTIGYWRLHGRNYRDWFRADAGRDNRYDYLYAQDELDQLVELIREVEQASEEAYVITNNHFRGKAVCNALELEHKLSGKSPRIPPPLQIEYPWLADRLK